MLTSVVSWLTLHILLIWGQRNSFISCWLVGGLRKLSHFCELLVVVTELELGFSATHCRASVLMWLALLSCYRKILEHIV